MKNNVRRNALLFCLLASTLSQGLPQTHIHLFGQGGLCLSLDHFLFLIYPQRDRYLASQ